MKIAAALLMVACALVGMNAWRAMDKLWKMSEKRLAVVVGAICGFAVIINLISIVRILRA